MYHALPTTHRQAMGVSAATVAIAKAARTADHHQSPAAAATTVASQHYGGRRQRQTAASEAAMAKGMCNGKNQ